MGGFHYRAAATASSSAPSRSTCARCSWRAPARCSRSSPATSCRPVRGGLGLLRAAPAVGALVMSLMLARRPLTLPIGNGAVRRDRGVRRSPPSCSRCRPILLLSLAALAVLGAADAVSVVIRFSLVQLRTPAEMRGRVSAVNGMFTGTSNYLGDFRAGAVAALIGAVPAVALGGAGVFLVTALWLFLFPQLRRIRSLDEVPAASAASGPDAMSEAAAGPRAPQPSRARACRPSPSTGDENGMRLDRFFEARFPGLSFSHIQRIIRKGEVRVNGKRAQPKDRLAGRPGGAHPAAQARAAEAARRRAAGPEGPRLPQVDHALRGRRRDGAQQADGARGAGRLRHLPAHRRHAGRAARPRDGQRPRLVHRLDKDTSGCLLVAKTRFAASALAKNFRSRSARKIYWALVVGVPRPKQGRISTFLAKEEREEDSVMRIARHGEEGASHAVTYYARGRDRGAEARLAVAQAGDRPHPPVARPHGRTSAIRSSATRNTSTRRTGNCPGGMQNKLHLLARRIAVPHPRGGTIDVTAPLPPHMQQILEPARLRRQALRSDRRGAGGGLGLARPAAGCLCRGSCGLR